MRIDSVHACLAPPLIEGESCLIGKFDAMGCPCEIVIDTLSPVIGRSLLEATIQEAQRIEIKFSRYRKGSDVDRINTSGGMRIRVDDEMSGLLDYADSSFELSNGLFDITTGVLRKVWRFDGSAQTVAQEDVKRLLPLVGWKKIRWERPFLVVPAGMEIDLGGICKEYAADRILHLLIQRSPLAMLVNLGGDIAAWGQRPWAVGIEDVQRPGAIIQTVHIKQGALATSGKTKRYVEIDGQRHAHILNPKTGWPIANPPKSVTVAARTCTEAGFWSTLAMLQGAGAEAFLKEQQAEFWCYR